MSSQSIPLFNIDTQSQEMTTVSFCQDLEGEFTGALMPMSSPLDTHSQWQHLIEGLLLNAIQIDTQADLNGLYVFSWWSDKNDKDCSGLLFTRLTKKVTSAEIHNLNLPSGSLGLLSVSNDLLGQKVITLALSGYVSANDGKLRSDRVLGTVISPENRLDKNIDDKTREDMLYMGDLLNQKLNENIASRQSVR